MFGWAYVRDTCIGLYEREQKTELFRTYIAECARMVTENTARMGGGGYMKIKYSELVSAKPVKPVEPGEPTANIRRKLR
jgi:hypothetical protein